MPALFSPVLAPPAVAREYGSLPSWLLIAAPAAAPDEDALHPFANRGEAEVIALARERDCTAVLDDRQARAAARRLGVRLLGTAGVLLRAKWAGLVPHVAPLLGALDAAGFRIGAPLRAEVLRRAGEAE